MNAKKELLELIADCGIIKCATVSYSEEAEFDTLTGKYIEGTGDKILPVSYTQEKYEEFMKSMDFNYDSGFGGQEVYGTIWFKNGTWATRGEYDGSEWWEEHKLPEIPENLTQQPLNKL